MLAVAAVSKWASVGVVKGDVAVDVGVVADPRSAVVKKAGTKGHLRYLQAAPEAVALFSATLRDSSGHHGTHFCKQRTVFCDVLRGLAGVAPAGFAASAATSATASAASAILGAFFVVACGLTVVVPLLSCILEAPHAVVWVLEADYVGLFLLDSRGVAAMLV